jgi:hypothetical protein
MTVPQTHGQADHTVRAAAMEWIGYGTLICLVFLALLSLALLDAREGLIRAREERRKLFRDTLESSRQERSAD